MAQCKGTNKQGKQCGRHVAPGNETCSIHADEIEEAPPVPPSRVDIYEKYLPPRLQQAYRETRERYDKGDFSLPSTVEEAIEQFKKRR
jgi:hypothetical protein